MSDMSAAVRTVALGELLAPSEVWQPDGSVEVDCYDMEGFAQAEPVVRPERAVPRAARRVMPGDVLLSVHANAPRRAWVVGPARGRPQIAAADWLVLRSGAIDAGYARHLLVSNEYELACGMLAPPRKGRRSAEPGVAASVTLRLPAVDVQGRAARVLDHADALRTRRAAILERSRMLAHALFAAQFGEASAAERTVAPLGSLLSEPPCRGTDVRVDARGRFPVIRAADLHAGEVSLSEARHVSHSDAALARSALADGDVLLAREPGRAAARVAIARPGDAVWFVHAKLWRLRLDAERLVPEYLRAWLASSTGQLSLVQAWASAGPGESVAQRMSSIAVALPPIREQRRYAERLGAADRMIGRMLVSAERLDALLGTLRDLAFRGELNLR